MTLGLAKQHERLAKALAETGINEKQQPLEYRAQAQVFVVLYKLTHQLYCALSAKSNFLVYMPAAAFTTQAQVPPLCRWLVCHAVLCQLPFQNTCDNAADLLPLVTICSGVVNAHQSPQVTSNSILTSILHCIQCKGPPCLVSSALIIPSCAFSWLGVAFAGYACCWASCKS